jgi:hypothetical protein
VRSNLNFQEMMCVPGISEVSCPTRKNDYESGGDVKVNVSQTFVIGAYSEAGYFIF